MTASLTAKKQCPKCSSADYLFRSRKMIEANPEQLQPEAINTKYRCKPCGHEWWVKVEGK